MKKTRMVVLGSVVALAAALVVACGDGAAGMQPGQPADAQLLSAITTAHGTLMQVTDTGTYWEIGGGAPPVGFSSAYATRDVYEYLVNSLIAEMSEALILLYGFRFYHNPEGAAEQFASWEDFLIFTSWDYTDVCFFNAVFSRMYADGRPSTGDLNDARVALNNVRNATLTNSGEKQDRVEAAAEAAFERVNAITPTVDITADDVMDAANYGGALYMYQVDWYVAFYNDDGHITGTIRIALGNAHYDVVVNLVP